MNNANWADSLPAAITVCDKDGTIIYMNAASAATFADSGGTDLLGKSLYDCHSPESGKQLQQMIATGASNTYTIQKHGKKKMIMQMPHFEGGIPAGLVEISIEIPIDMAHHNRDAK